MSDIYKTILAPTEGVYKEKGSKFLSFAIPVHNVDEIKELVKNYRKQYYDARHVCYAYMIGTEHKEWRANDDGEPSETAGRPIIGQINSRELTNVLVVVVRYFGGILLGTSGLITAYKEAAADALNQAEVVEKTIDSNVSIRFDYVLMNDVMKIVKDTSAQIDFQNFDNNCQMRLVIRKQEEQLLRAKLEKINGLTLENEGQS